MLDLDALAEQRARHAKEQVEPWLNEVWGAPFQRMAQNMSDGEVIDLLNGCPTLAHLKALIQTLSDPDQQSQPVATLIGLAKSAGFSSLHDWIQTLA